MLKPVNWIPRPDCPRAYAVTVCSCGDPDCFPHLIARDEAGNAIVEIVLPRNAIEDIKAWDKENAKD